MPYTTEEGGRLNNFAVEPRMYEAEPPSKNQMRNYVVLGVLGVALIAGLCIVATTVS